MRVKEQLSARDTSVLVIAVVRLVFTRHRPAAGWGAKGNPLLSHQSYWPSLVTDCSTWVRNAGSASIYIFNWVEGKQDQPFIFFRIWEAFIFFCPRSPPTFSAKICQEENAKEKENIPRNLLSIMHCFFLKTKQSTSIITDCKS